MALNTLYDTNQAVLVNITDGSTQLDSYTFPRGSEVDHSCTLIFKNEVYIFGGGDRKRQISQVSDCRLTRIGSLTFDFTSRACTTIHESTLMLCFDADVEGRVCRLADKPTGLFNKIIDSNFHHYDSKIASNNGTFK